MINVIDSSGRVGEQPSVAITTGDVVYISYFDATNQALKLAQLSLTSIGSVQNVTLTVVDNGNDGDGTPAAFAVGLASSLVLSNDNPIIVYSRIKQGTTEIRLVSLVDSIRSIVYRPMTQNALVAASLAATVGADMLPLIALIDQTTGLVQVFHPTSSSLASFSSTIIDRLDVPSTMTLTQSFSLSLAVSQSGYGLLTYSSPASSRLQLAQALNSNFTLFDLRTVVSIDSDLTISSTISSSCSSSSAIVSSSAMTASDGSILIAFRVASVNNVTLVNGGNAVFVSRCGAVSCCNCSCRPECTVISVSTLSHPISTPVCSLSLSMSIAESDPVIVYANPSTTSINERCTTTLPADSNTHIFTSTCPNRLCLPPLVSLRAFQA